MYKKLIKSDQKCNFYTNISSKSLFEALFKVFSPYARRSYTNNANGCSQRNNVGRKKLLSSIDEMLLTLMKIKLGLSFEDLGDLFRVSKASASRIFSCWIRAVHVQ